MTHLDENNETIWASSGSYNITGGSPSNIESLLFFTDPEICRFMLNEVKQIMSISRKYY